MPADLPIEEQAELYARFGEAAARDRAERGVPPRPRPARGSCISRLGKPIEAAEMLMLTAIAALTGRLAGSGRPALTDQAIAELADLPPSQERDRARAFLLERTRQ